MVLKCRFYYLLGRVRPEDQEKIVIEKTVSYRSQKEGAPHPNQGHTGKQQGPCGDRRREHGVEFKEFFLGFQWERQGMAG